MQATAQTAAPQPQLAIEARGLCIGFAGNAVLKGVDFVLRAGEVHALAGINGAGKSTLMKILNGLYRKDEGVIRVFGEECHFRTPQDARAAGIAMVYQDLSLVPSMTVADNIFLGHWTSNGLGLIDTRGVAAAARALLAKVGVEAEVSPGDLLGSLSPGQQQLVEIAKALSTDARILILDEPTASLSNHEIDQLFAVLMRLRAEGVSMVYITHYLRDIFEICDSVTVLRDGRAVRSAPVSQVDQALLIAEMVGRDVDAAPSWSRPPVVPGATPLLELEGVGTAHVENVSLTLYPGEIVGLAGLLGSGRTEILKAIFGLDPVHGGRLLLEGKPVRIGSPRDAIDAGIHLVPEDRRSQGLVLDFSVSDNTLMSIHRQMASPLLLDRRRSRGIVQQFIRQLGVKTTGPEQITRFLSGGNQQKVVVARCLSTGARVLLLDDPTFGVDLHAKHEIMRIIDAYVAQGNAALFVSTEYGEIASFCDRIYIVKQRTIAAQLPAQGQSEESLLAAVQ
ncbi:sugar ABC transporter ATP-binding protein [Verminephrobacter aporrectodeae subsp. tuberculatae]|uniref:sugar ABC transporter ATP-binding protein n=1 Tax=Verminephrobacter aporrectodeae TaxID=1110389 RepID=UPI00223743B8|nr:sugar ABC transporter ATP-binding protein [Verminephrobacter aporrectodeae]MCW5258151.1 sugar ABC transporter ATP-binding protein [Verminephrobacter aporrectodeae subsp. tuberculatae]